MERQDLETKGQQLLRHTEWETELGLPVHDRSGKPADQCAQGRASEQPEDESGDRAREHRAADGQADEKVVHHARRLTLDRPKIATMSTNAGSANSDGMKGIT